MCRHVQPMLLHWRFHWISRQIMVKFVSVSNNTCFDDTMIAHTFDARCLCMPFIFTHSPTCTSTFAYQTEQFCQDLTYFDQCATGYSPSMRVLAGLRELSSRFSPCMLKPAYFCEVWACSIFGLHSTLHLSAASSMSPFAVATKYLSTPKEILLNSSRTQIACV